MATAVAMASDKQGRPLYDVIGVDLPNDQGTRRVDDINKGVFPFPTSDSRLVDAILKAVRRGNLKATTDASCYANADVVIVDVHLDIPYLDSEPELDFTHFKNALRTIGERIKEGALVIVETTVPPGTCEHVVVPTLSEELRKRGMPPGSILVAHSYERVMPGEHYLESITDFWRVYSGHTDEAADACAAFLSSVINVEKYPLTRLSSTVASETAKVMENCYRAMNIAFLDEWTKYAESVGIDMFEVVDAIRVRPTHSNIRFPGLGVGGYCLTKDPMFAPAAAKQLFNKDLEFPFSRMAVKINHQMPLHAVVRLKAMLSGSLAGKRILVCGISYRPDVGDTRNSPSETLVRELLKDRAEVVVHDPYVGYWDELEMGVLEELPGAQGFDACVFAVAHRQYRELDLAAWVSGAHAAILDANSVFTRAQRDAVRKQGICMESVGRGAGL